MTEGKPTPKKGYQKKSGHGSITKAGKVRNNTPKIPSLNRKKACPRVHNRQKAKRLLGNRVREIYEREGIGWEAQEHMREEGRWYIKFVNVIIKSLTRAKNRMMPHKSKPLYRR
jgi:small subunit ribosomal protein S30e